MVISSESNSEAGREPGQDQGLEAAADSAAEAVEVLREVWAAKGQDSEDLAEAFGTARSCKSMQDVGFDAMAGADGDLRSAWRATLQREGKLGQGGSLRDLVLGPAES